MSNPTGKKYRKHGDRDAPLYKAWSKMKDRCHNPMNADFHFYGGRGISVCPGWRNNYIHFKYWALKNGYKKAFTYKTKLGG